MQEAACHTAEGQVRRLIQDCLACSSRPYRLARTSHLRTASGTPFELDLSCASIVVSESGCNSDPGLDLYSRHESQPRSNCLCDGTTSSKDEQVGMIEEKQAENSQGNKRFRTIQSPPRRVLTTAQKHHNSPPTALKRPISRFLC